jgi:hypothetical protein
MLVERRASPRLPEFKRAEIVFDDDRSRITCIVVNASDKGAMLRVPVGAVFPDTFNLHIGDKLHAAWIAWKGTGAIGVNWLD